MTIYFADTFFYLALMNSRDAYHARVADFAERDAIRIVTTQFVIIEIADALAGSGGRAAFQPMLRALEQDRRTRVVRFSQTLLHDATDLYISRRDKDWSLTDCTSFVVMRRMGLRRVLTGDHHFKQAGFEPMFERP